MGCDPGSESIPLAHLYPHRTNRKSTQRLHFCLCGQSLPKYLRLRTFTHPKGSDYPFATSSREGSRRRFPAGRRKMEDTVFSVTKIFKNNLF